jgi:hypothetical protein
VIKCLEPFIVVFDAFSAMVFLFDRLKRVDKKPTGNMNIISSLSYRSEKVKVKRSPYKPGVAQRVPGS